MESLVMRGDKDGFVGPVSDLQELPFSISSITLIQVFAQHLANCVDMHHVANMASSSC